MTLENLTVDHFAPHVGEQFRIRHSSGETLEIELVEAKSLGTQTPNAGAIGPKVELREAPFSILFRGPKEVLAPQGMYDFEHASIGPLEGLFITPVGEDDEGFYYEAVFN